MISVLQSRTFKGLIRPTKTCFPYICIKKIISVHQFCIGNNKSHTYFLLQTDFKYYYTAQPFKPVTDLNDEDSFLPKPLIQLADDVPPIPIIMGSTNMDGAIAFAGSVFKQFHFI